MAELQLANRFDMLDWCGELLAPAVGSGDFSSWVADVRVGSSSDLDARNHES